jgi:hypothetical protein
MALKYQLVMNLHDHVCPDMPFRKEVEDIDELHDKAAFWLIQNGARRNLLDGNQHTQQEDDRDSENPLIDEMHLLPLNVDDLSATPSS